jgi:hypothetical protein
MPASGPEGGEIKIGITIKEEEGEREITIKSSRRKKRDAER